ncbi:chorismate mutase [Geotalea toluenoxydans]
MQIDDYREKIDQLDNELLRIFNERAGLALKIGEIKKGLALPVYDPSREKKIFQRMKAENPGPLDDQAIVRLFERVIDESRRLERLMTRQQILSEENDRC